MLPAYSQKRIPFGLPVDSYKKAKTSVKHTLLPVPREDSNLEAEVGERAVVSDGSGLPTQFGIGGQRHSSGGTPLNLPANSFIFSRDNSMKIRDESIQKMFGMAPNKSGYTPAEIAKKFDINNYRKVLADKNSDKLQRDSAESMIENYNQKLAQLSLIQESMKGFSGGIPMIAMPYMHTSGLNPAQLLQQEESDESDEEENPSEEQARYGMNIIPELYRQNAMQFGGQNYFKKGGEFRAPVSNKGMVEIQYAKPMTKEGYNIDEDNMEQDGGETLRRVRVIAPGQMALGGQPKYEEGGFSPVDVTPYKGKAGEKTPTGRNPRATRDADWYKENYKKAGIDAKTATDAEAQSTLYDKADPFRKAHMWGLYGNTNKGGDKDKYAQFAPKEGESFDTYKERMVSQYGSPEGLNKELEKYKSNFADGNTGERTAYLLDAHLNPDKEVEPTTSRQNTSIANTPATKKTEQPLSTIKTNPVNGSNEQVPADFWLQDIIKTAGAAGDQFRIKKYLPWAAPYTPTVPQATFYDPTRELGQNAELANTSAQAAGMFGSPQSLMANLSAIQGQAGQNAANVMGKYNNMNVSASNQNEAARADTVNQAAQYNSNMAMNLYDKNTIANQQFDNAKAMARQNLRNSFIEALTNRGQTQALNSLYPQFAVNPLSGGTTKYTGKAREVKPEDAEKNSRLDYLEKIAPRLRAMGVPEPEWKNYI